VPWCPKCEQEYRSGFSACGDCGVDLVEVLERPETRERAEREAEDIAVAYFEHPTRGRVVFCPNCFREFGSDQARCRPCGDLAVEALPEDRFASLLERGPLRGYARFEHADDAQEDRPATARVAIVGDPTEAAWLLDQLRGMGLEAEIGDDLRDDFGEDGRLGIHVPPDEVEAAEMLLPQDGLKPTPEPLDESYHGLLRRADTYAGLGRNRYAWHLVQKAVALDPEAPEAFVLLGEILGRRGLVEEATQAWEEAIDRLGEGQGHPAHFFAAIYGFLDEGGEPKFRGPRGDRAWSHLRAYLEANPRSVRALQLALEAALARGHVKIAREYLVAMDDLNHRLFSYDGPHTRAARDLAQGN
jgi:tetratricopeptide (TPR) repeat protein